MINYVEVQNNGYILRGLYNKAENEKGLLVMFHGFTGHMNENGYLFKKLTSELEKVNISTIRFDFMGSGMSDGEFKDMTFLTECEDAKAILNYCIKNYKTNLYALGFSCGGAVLGYIINEYKDVLKKIVLASPAGDMDKIGEGYYNNPNVIWYDSENIDMGGYLMNKKFIDTLTNLDLYQNISSYKNPVLITHGEKDLAVPIEYGRKYESLLSNVTFKEIKGSPHCYTKMEYRKEFNEAVVNFLK